MNTPGEWFLHSVQPGLAASAVTHLSQIIFINNNKTMHSPSCDLTPAQIVSISRSDRWLAYQRLQELSIPCDCAQDGHLRVAVDSAEAAIQVWSVIRQLTASRSQLIQWLERCWQPVA
jgi:hypothetical protein